MMMSLNPSRLGFGDLCRSKVTAVGFPVALQRRCLSKNLLLYIGVLFFASLLVGDSLWFIHTRTGEPQIDNHGERSQITRIQKSSQEMVETVVIPPRGDNWVDIKGSSSTLSPKLVCTFRNYWAPFKRWKSGWVPWTARAKLSPIRTIEEYGDVRINGSHLKQIWTLLRPFAVVTELMTVSMAVVQLNVVGPASGFKVWASPFGVSIAKWSIWFLGFGKGWTSIGLWIFGPQIGTFGSIGPFHDGVLGCLLFSGTDDLQILAKMVSTEELLSVMYSGNPPSHA